MFYILLLLSIQEKFLTESRSSFCDSIIAAIAIGLITEPGSNTSIEALFLKIDLSVIFFLFEGLKEGLLTKDRISPVLGSTIITDPECALYLSIALFN